MRLIGKKAGLVASVAVCAALLSSCSREVDIPPVSGNTYSHLRYLSANYPDQTMVNISYEFELVSEQQIAVPGRLRGPSWLYRSRSEAESQRFIFLHVVTSESGDGIPAGSIERFGKRDYTAIPFCSERAAVEDETLRPYLTVLEEQGFALSSELFGYRFFPRTLEIDGQRIDLLYIEDIERDGIRCADFGPDIDDPVDEAVDIASRYQSRAFSSFEIIN